MTARENSHGAFCLPLGVAFFLSILVCLLGTAAARAQQTAAGTSPAVPDQPILRIETGGHTARINAVSTDARGRYLVTGSADKTVRVWDAASGALLSVLRPPIGDGTEGEILGVALSPNAATLVCGGSTGHAWDGSDCLYVFDRATGHLRRRLLGLPHTIDHLAFSPDGRYLAATLSSGGLRVYRTGDWSLADQDSDYADLSEDACFSADGSHLVTACYDGFVRLYRLGGTGRVTLIQKSKAPGGGKPVTASFSPDGARIAVGFADSGKVDLLSGKDLLRQASPDTNGVENGNLGNVCWSPDGQSLYAGGDCHDGSRRIIIRCWSSGGLGAYRDTEVSINTILSLQPRPAGGVFFGTGEPAWGALGAGGDRSVFVGPAIVDMRSTSFRLSSDGSAVSFGFEAFDQTPAVFSLGTRSLRQGEAGTDLSAPVVSATGLDVQDWYVTTHPTLNGRPLRLSDYERSHSLAIAPDDQSFLLGCEWSIRCFGADGQQRWKVSSAATAWCVNVSQDGKVGVAGFGDGTIHWYRMSDGKELLALFPAADRRRWVLWSPSGYYDCSAGGEDLIGWHLNHGADQAADFFPASRFRGAFYRPDVIRRVLGAQDEAVALDRADADSSRKAQTVPTTALVTAGLPPVVTILSPQDGAAVSSGTVRVQYSLRTPSGAPVTGVKVLVDGRPAGATRDLRLVANTASGTVRQVAVSVPHRDCRVSVVASNAHASSEAATVRLVWQGTASPAFVIKPTLYVLAIGVSKFSDASVPPLTYPARDARNFAGVLLPQKGRLYADVREKVITDGQATRDNILDGLDWIERQTTQHDVAMVFLAGHGANDSDGGYLFIPTNFSPEHIRSTALDVSDIKKTLERLAGKTLFFVDTCHSGNVMGTTQTRDLDITGAVNELSSAENGAIVFAASTGKQVALEDPAWGDGAFTKALVEALSGKADYNHDGKITVNMLDLYLSTRVKELTKGEQTPTTTKPQTVPDFPVAIKGK